MRLCAAVVTIEVYIAISVIEMIAAPHIASMRTDAALFVRDATHHCPTVTDPFTDRR